MYKVDVQFHKLLCSTSWIDYVTMLSILGLLLLLFLKRAKTPSILNECCTGSLEKYPNTSPNMILIQFPGPINALDSFGPSLELNRGM